MPRAAPVHQPAAAPPSSGLETALTLHRTPAELRLEALDKEHERLLREIRKKKAACTVTEERARDLSSALDARLGPVRVAFVAALKELRGIFAALLGDSSRLNRRDKAKVRRLLLQILPDLAGASDDAAESGAAGSRNGSFAGGQREPIAADAESGYSANKPSEQAGLLRAVFRRLAIALHPDKEQDPGQRETLTAVMKEVTRAYETGDVARLVELERSWLSPPVVRAEGEDLARRTAQLLAANKELRSQLRSLNAELKELKQTLPSLGGPQRRGRKASTSIEAEVEELARQAEQELSQMQTLRDFARSFQEDEIELSEFLLGPELCFGRAADPFDQMLEEMLASVAEGRIPPRGAGGGGRARRGSRGR